VRSPGEEVNPPATQTALHDLPAAAGRGHTAVQPPTVYRHNQEANRWAGLGRLGIEFIQGYFVNSPEQVVM